MLFSDNQTKHFYVIPVLEGYTVKDLENSDLFTLILNQDNNKKVTTDVINRKLIKHAKINKVKPTYFRKWTVTAPSTVTAGNTYHIYFYLENMMGFGTQNRWDKVASYTAKTSDTAAVVMQHLAVDLFVKLNMGGPIMDDFTISYGGTTVTETMVEDGTLPTAVSGTNIVVAENPNSETFAQLTELDLKMHTNPYAYNVTMSTGEANGNEITPWGNQKQITGVEDNTIDPYIKASTKVLAMELYFLRNRVDKYDLTKDFYASILNKPQAITANADYYTLDIDYAFSDTQGYTYHSDKQLSIACGAPAPGSGTNPALTTLENLRKAILIDSNETSLGYTDTTTYTQATGDED